MKRFFHFWFFLIPAFLTSGIGHSQILDSSMAGPVLNSPFRSLQIGLARNTLMMRDFATSPLFYKGNPFLFSLAWAKEEGKKDRRLQLQYQSGILSAENNYSSLASIQNLSIQYSRLWYLASWKKTDLRLGGLVDFSGNIRLNPSLQNNGGGFELLNTLFVSARLGRDMSRKRVKAGKFLWLIRYRRIPRRRTLSFQLNAALMNNNFRNGYLYTNHANITNHPDPFYNYRMNLFSGYRLSSSLEYSIFLKNGNAFRFAWNWDALFTDTETNRFEMAQQTLQFAFLFQIPKREKK